MVDELTTDSGGGSNVLEDVVPEDFVSPAEDVCPCERSIPDSWKLSCTKCSQEWHTWCVGLKGLISDDVATGKKQIESLKEWICPLCYPKCAPSPVILAKIRDYEEETVKDGEERNSMRVEIAKMTTTLTAAVTQAVKESLKEEHVNMAVQDANVKVAKSWAEITKSTQQDLITDVVKKSSKIALSESIQLIDSNLTEQRKRTRNIVVSGIPEQPSENSSDMKTEMVDILGGELAERDILAAFRLGDAKKQRTKPRPILVKLRSEDDANYFHSNGRGYQVGGSGSETWINPDLTQAERTAAYNKRQEKLKLSAGLNKPVATSSAEGLEKADSAVPTKPKNDS